MSTSTAFRGKIETSGIRICFAGYMISTYNRIKVSSSGKHKVPEHMFRTQKITEGGNYTVHEDNSFRRKE